MTTKNIAYLFENYKNCNIENKCLNIQIKSIAYDSRKSEEGSMFIAIKGLKDDGHKYIEKAILNGAKAVVYDKKENKENDIEKLAEKYKEVCFISADNPRETLAFVSKKFYDEPTKNMHIIAVTGTNGKTTTTYLLKSVLEAAKHETTLIGTIKNMIGGNILKTNLTTPESLDLEEIFSKSLKENINYVVMEASSQALSMNRCDYLDYDAAIFTNLTEDHLDYHLDMKNYLYAKMKLFDILSKSKKEKKLAIVNIDTDYFDEISAYIKKLNIPMVTFGINEKADYYAKIISLTTKKIEYAFYANGKFIQNVELSLLGRFNILNSLSVLAYACEYGIDIKESIKAMKYIQVDGRFEIVTKENDTFIVAVDYSHTPDSLKNILTSAKALNPNRVIVVFGCGGDRDRKKRPIMAKIAADYSDMAFLTLDNQRTENIEQIMSDIEKGFEGSNFKYKKVIDRKLAIEEAIKEAKENDIVIIAGKGHETYQILSDKTIHFDDREVAREALSKL